MVEGGVKTPHHMLGWGNVHIHVKGTCLHKHQNSTLYLYIGASVLISLRTVRDTRKLKTQTMS